MTTYSLQDIIQNRNINLTCCKCNHTVSISYNVLVNCDVLPVCPLCSSELPRIESDELKRILITFIDSLKSIEQTS